MNKLIIIYLIPIYILAKNIIIYSECDYPPYSYCEDNDTTIKGISVDIFKSIFEKLPNYRLEIKGIEWTDAMNSMREEHNNTIRIIGTISYRPKERPFIKNYTNSFINSRTTIFCKKKFLKHEWPKDFYNLKISYMNGFSMNEKLSKAVDDNLIELKYGNDRENILALFNDEVDCYINDELTVRGKILELRKEYKDKGLDTKEFDKIHKIITIEKVKYHIGFSDHIFPEKEHLIKNINLAIKIMKNSDEIEMIIEKHLKYYLDPDKNKNVSIGLYDWGKYLVSHKLYGYGILPEIVKSAFSYSNIDVEYTFHHYKYSYLLAKWGKDCATLPWLKTKDREIYFEYSDNIKTTGLYAFYNKKKYPEGIGKLNLTEFMKYKIGIINKNTHKNFLDKHIELKYKIFESMDTLVKALIKGEIDIIPTEKSRFLSFIEKYFFTDLKYISYVKEPIKQDGNYVMFSKRCKNSKELRNKFNMGLKIIRDNGTLDKILDKFDLDHLDNLDLNRKDFY